MDQHYFVCFLLVFMLVCADCAYSQALYFIKSSQIDPCLHYPCATLAQFAANSNNHNSIVNETSLSLLFLPGNHTLDRELSLSQKKNFTMVIKALDSETVTIECISKSGRFNISNTIFLWR